LFQDKLFSKINLLKNLILSYVYFDLWLVNTGLVEGRWSHTISATGIVDNFEN